MANTFSQIYIQVIFAVQNRHCLISTSWEDELYKYITGVITNNGQKLIAINGMPDHIHFLVGMKPNCCLSNMVKDIKIASNEHIKKNKFTSSKFNWQEGFGAFSYSHSQLDIIIKYIQNQKQHHKKMSFKEEYIGFLKKYQIEFKDEYVFDWIIDEE